METIWITGASSGIGFVDFLLQVVEHGLCDGELTRTIIVDLLVHNLEHAHLFEVGQIIGLCHVAPMFHKVHLFLSIVHVAEIRGSHNLEELGIGIG